MPFQPRRLRQLGNRISINIPADPEGYIGRECPQAACEGYFKVKPGTGLTGPGLTCTCPYCGHTASPDQFWTKDQVKYAESIALRHVSDALAEDLKELEFEHKPQGAFGIGFSLKFTPGTPHPLHRYREKALETRVSCGACTLEYAVFGVFAFCPDCATHNSGQILERNLDLTRRQAALAAAQEDPELQRQLLEDALENCVSSFDGFARETCRIRAAASSDSTRCSNVSFQNLPRAARALAQLFGVDLVGSVTTADWALAHKAFMRRHLLAHRAAVVDQQYLDETGDTTVVLGRRLPIAIEDVLALTDVVARIGNVLVSLLPPPK